MKQKGEKMEPHPPQITKVDCKKNVSSEKKQQRLLALCLFLCNFLLEWEKKKGVGLNRESNPGLSYPKGEFYHLTIEPLHF